MKRIVILTGAGMSVESGLGTFRGGGGLWDSYPVELVATPEGYRANPALVLEFYNKRRRELLTVEPNEGHRLVAALQERIFVDRSQRSRNRNLFKRSRLSKCRSINTSSHITKGNLCNIGQANKST